MSQERPQQSSFDQRIICFEIPQFAWNIADIRNCTLAPPLAGLRELGIDLI